MSKIVNREIKSKMEKILRTMEKFIPRKIFRFFQPFYHQTLAFLAACFFRFPSKKIRVVAVTGTKGKSTVVELLNSVFEESGEKTALLSTIRFKIAENSQPNKHKMTVPGRFFVQKFLREVVDAGCDIVILEMTSEGVKQYRHKFIALDALVVTNLAPEHIESHGSYENYVAAKVEIAKALEKSPKTNKILAVNGDDKEAEKFLGVFSGKKVVYSKRETENAKISENGISFEMRGCKITSKLPGEFNFYNILAAVSLAEAMGISSEKIKAGIEKLESVRGRAEEIENSLGIKILVDYAHTPDSLEKLYKTYENRRKICVLGNTGGGRDKWKRPVMGGIAEKYCDEIILTNEDPYNEKPLQIIKEMADGMNIKTPKMVLDRREAIRTALTAARKESPADNVNTKKPVVLITGKGTDPYIMGKNGSKIVWDDATVVREELEKLFEVVS
ncbi:MAG: UDP-N-acetylmuramyl-tripeptide synthetase [bacterium]|nr:UDP-N-acetylmuramyl-tripeptide synthetase [bacterium]